MKYITLSKHVKVKIDLHPHIILYSGITTNKEEDNYNVKMLS